MAIFKLYYTPASCGGVNYVAAHLAGLDFEAEQVNFTTKKTASGADFLKINPKGNVPTIVFPDGTMLNEGIATLTYIADQNPASGLAPPHGTPERYQLFNALAFINSEFHPWMRMLFKKNITGETREMLKEEMISKVQYFMKNILDGKDFALGDKPSVADIYAYIAFKWPGFIDIDVMGVKGVKEFLARVAAFPGVSEAQKMMEAAPTA